MKKGKKDGRWLLGFADKNLPAGLLFFISHLSLNQETERGPPALPDLELKGNPEIKGGQDSGKQSRAPEVLSVMSEDSEHTAVSGHN